TDAEVREAADVLRERARNGEPLDDLLYECFALVREAGKRSLGMRHFDVQLIGGMVLHDGAIAEMKTGEGKTLTATLAVVLNSLGGRGVHLVTVADFDFEVDEKYKTVSITERGVAKAERFLRIDHLYRAENGHLVNHLQQALKAQALYHRDKDYAVIDGEVKIIDEFTGRILEGR